MVLFSFRHLLTWELEIKPAFLKDEKVVGRFLPAHMKGLPSRAWKTLEMSVPWVLETPVLQGTSHRFFPAHSAVTACSRQLSFQAALQLLKRNK